MSPNDGANYASLMEHVRSKVDALGTRLGRDYELSVASPAGFDKIRNFNLAGLAPHVDFLNLMSYDFHGTWEKTTGHQSAFTGDPIGYDIKTAVDLYRAAGVPASKIVLGAPLYTRGWSGTGFVATPGDFGTAGERPSHPALLDWLARRFIDHGWSLKWLHREIVMSTTYRQDSRPVAAAVAVDPDTRLVWRYPPQRLDAESIHDAMLSAAGVLDLSMGGPGVVIYHPKLQQFDEWRPREDPGPAAWRRMIYLAKMRGSDDGMFKVFDLPDCGQVRDKRGDSTTPLQALNLMNGPFTVRAAGGLADRLRREAGSDPAAQVERLFAILFARPPTPAELRACVDTLQSENLETVCRAAFNANEFLFRP